MKILIMLNPKEARQQTGPLSITNGCYYGHSVKIMKTITYIYLATALGGLIFGTWLSFELDRIDREIITCAEYAAGVNDIYEPSPI